LALDSCNPAQIGAAFSGEIKAKVGCTGVLITDIQVLGPTGLTKSNLELVNGTTDQWQITFSWTPTAAQVGENIICFKANDDVLQSSDTYCFKILAGFDAPAVVEPTQNYTGILSDLSMNNTVVWSIDFDQPIQKPSQPANIYFYDTNDTIVYQLDVTSNATLVKFENFTLSFETNAIFSPGNYYITFDEGVIVSSLYCQAPSKAYLNNTFWTFFVNETEKVLILSNIDGTIVKEFKCHIESFAASLALFLGIFGLAHIVIKNSILLFFLYLIKFSRSRII
jgi:hypothetical protein